MQSRVEQFEAHEVLGARGRRDTPKCKACFSKWLVAAGAAFAHRAALQPPADDDEGDDGSEDLVYI